MLTLSATGLVVSFSVVILSGCSSGDITHQIYEHMLDSPDHKALVKNPKYLVGKYYEIKPEVDFIGSRSVEGALEAQSADQMERPEFEKKIKEKQNFDSFRSKEASFGFVR